MKADIRETKNQIKVAATDEEKSDLKIKLADLKKKKHQLHKEINEVVRSYARQYPMPSYGGGYRANFNSSNYSAYGPYYSSPYYGNSTPYWSPSPNYGSSPSYNAASYLGGGGVGGYPSAGGGWIGPGNPGWH